MSQFSRVNKNKELYEQLIQDDNTEIIEASLRDYERRMSRTSSDDEYVASRLKRNQNLNLEVEQEVGLKQPNIQENSIIDDEKRTYQAAQVDTDSIQIIKPEVKLEDEVIVKVEDQVITKEHLLNDRELLDDFIEEVKRYNINRGLRNVQDTQMNILQNLTNDDDQEIARAVQYDTVEIESVSELTQEIQQIIENLDNDLEEEENEVVEPFTFIPLNEDKDEELSSVFNEIETSALDLSSLIPKENEVKSVVYEEVTEEIVKQPDFKANELLDLTNTLNLRLDLQERELETVKSKSSLIDKILTGLIAFFVIALVIIIVVGIWWVYKERGL